MVSPPHEKLSRREREIIDALFALGDRASAEEIRERLSDPPTYSAVRAMLVRLETKGYVRHREEGLRYIYMPTKSRASAQRNALSKVVRVFFSGTGPRDVPRDCEEFGGFSTNSRKHYATWAGPTGWGAFDRFLPVRCSFCDG